MTGFAGRPGLASYNRRSIKGNRICYQANKPGKRRYFVGLKPLYIPFEIGLSAFWAQNE
jgi:hypothetical protein